MLGTDTIVEELMTEIDNKFITLVLTVPFLGYSILLFENFSRTVELSPIHILFQSIGIGVFFQGVLAIVVGIATGLENPNGDPEEEESAWVFFTLMVSWMVIFMLIGQANGIGAL